MSSSFPAPYRVIVGREAFAAVAEQIVGSAVMVTDEDLAASPPVAELIEAPVLTLPSGEPNLDTVDRLAARLPLDATIVAIGGGSVLDTVKLAAAAATMDASVKTFIDGAAEPENRLTVVAVPTTAGTGSEVTRSAVVSDRGRKTWAWGDQLRPDIALLDPRLTISCPPGLTTGAGVDALVHAIEAATGQATTMEIRPIAAEAVDLIFEHLPSATRDGDDVEARTAMQRAATLAGIAIDQCNTGLAHAIGHALSTRHRVPHGISVGIGLRATIEWSMAADPSRYDPVAKPLTGFPDRFDALFDAIGFPALAARFLPAERDPQHLTDVITAIENLPMCRNNSRVPTEVDVLDLAAATYRWWAEAVA